MGATVRGDEGGPPGEVMGSEMAEQPARLADLLARRHGWQEQLRSLLPRPLAGTVLVARGSSDHAATCGRYLLEMATHRPVASASPSVQTLYGTAVDLEGYLVIAVSQSGRTPEITELLDRARSSGARTLAITNDGESPLAAVAELAICTEVGPELAVPATKTVTAQLVAFAIVAQAYGDIGLGPKAADALPHQVADVLDDDAAPQAVADWLRTTSRLATVARGLLYGAAAEAALKIEETTSLFAGAFSAADLRHGPIAVASTGIPIVAFAHPGPACADVIDLVGELRRRGAGVRLAGPVPGTDLPWSAEAPETLAPVLAVVRAQQVARLLALGLGRDPDAPGGLTKVTAT